MSNLIHPITAFNAHFLTLHGISNHVTQTNFVYTTNYCHVPMYTSCLYMYAISLNKCSFYILGCPNQDSKKGHYFICNSWIIKCDISIVMHISRIIVSLYILVHHCEEACVTDLEGRTQQGLTFDCPQKDDLIEIVFSQFHSVHWMVLHIVWYKCRWMQCTLCLFVSRLCMARRRYRSLKWSGCSPLQTSAYAVVVMLSFPGKTSWKLCITWNIIFLRWDVVTVMSLCL